MAYNYNSDTHNSTDPEIIVPIIISLFNPTSVVDIGCGTGNFLAEFKKLGVNTVLGVDADTQSSNLRMKNLSSEEYLLQDLNQYFLLQKNFDLALCLEVGEHLNEKSADALVNTLIRCSDVIIFSAAIPLQGGQYHINEQWQSYWKNKFEKYHFLAVDSIRPLIWNNSNLKYWYKQNLIVYISSTSSFKKVAESTSTNYIDIVHPENYNSQVRYLQNILEGKSSFIFYCYLFFKYFKSFFKRR